MAEVDGQEKTEQATGKKLSETRDKGRVAKSMEINSLAVFSTGFLLIFMMKKHLGNSIGNFSLNIFRDVDKLQLSKDLVVGYAIKGIAFFFITLWPIFAGLIIISLVASYGQTGFKFSTKALAPQFSKLNLFSNIKGIFFSTRSLVEVGKSILKLVIIGSFTYWVLKDFIISAIHLVDYQIDEIITFMIEASYSLLLKISLVYAVMASSDFIYQKFKFKHDLMMTKQEVKEEAKQSEGDPIVKNKIKSIMIKNARSRMMKELPKADVVITNPTHYAIALKYDMEKDAAPRVIAKGMDELAQKIKKVATENGIPLHEDRELARALYKSCEIGDEIPAALFKTVAQILAYIFKLRNEKKKKSIV